MLFQNQLPFRRASLLLAASLIIFNSAPLHSGGVFAVAGTSGFDPNVAGKPITWANGQLNYYTDQGNLSAVLDQNAANDFVATAFQRWTTVPNANVSAVRSGSLNQDVNGGNVSSSADIQPTATNKPLAIIYDQDGAGTDALLGAGAGASTLCGTNAVFGGADTYTTSAHFAHSLIVINGNCAQQTSDLPLLKYKLVRTIGQILGVGWSQLNDNVRTGTPS
ncbi:MAG TPA: hypothetical protein VM056_06225, partial [Terriglobales bacterium]|nr:hypothetical protein [Terriglobales bacterium]